MSLPGIWYHGSPRTFNRFSLPSRYSPQEQLGFGIHFAKKKSFATMYGDILYACRLHPKRVFNFAIAKVVKKSEAGSEKDRMAKDILRGTGRIPYFIEKDAYVFPNPDIKSPKKAEEIFRKYGFDAILYEAKYGSRTFNGHSHGMRLTNESRAVVILDPSAIEIVSRIKVKS